MAFAESHEANAELKATKGAESQKDFQSDHESEDEFVTKLWLRLDRDQSGTLTRQELDTEPFHNLLRAAVAPISGTHTGGASYARTAMNMKEAISMCMRKADHSEGSVLRFEEFRSLVRTLRNPYGSKHLSDLAFSLFDIDGSDLLDSHEFHELLRFYLGKHPTSDMFMAEWKRASGGLQQTITKQQYVRWLQTSTDRAFRQHAPGVRDMPPTPDSFQLERAKPKWNRHFASQSKGARPQGKRDYFMRPQSLDELSIFYKQFEEGFERHKADLAKPRPTPARCALFPRILSTEGGTPMMLPERHNPGGTSRDHDTGLMQAWEDNWVPPLRLRHRDRAGDRPLAIRATFPELSDSLAQMSRSTMSRSTSSIRSVRDREKGTRLAEIGPARETLLQPEPWSGLRWCS